MNKEQYVPDMHGCSDGGCLFAYKAPGTMVTNGGCSCMKELTRTDVGFRAYRTILWLRQQQPTPQADRIADMLRNSLCPEIESPRPTRTMLHKVNMIKEIREQAGCGLKEAKEAMDAVYPHCSTFDEVVAAGVARWKRNNGYCVMGDNCLCTEVPERKATCFEWRKGQ